MYINPQTIVQVLMNKNPQMMQQIQQFQQQLQSNKELQSKYNAFRTNMTTNPQMRQQVIQEVANKIGVNPTPGPK